MQEQCGHGKVSAEDGAQAGCSSIHYLFMYFIYILIYCVWFEVLVTMAMNITAVLYVTPCSLADM
jgi:hypothetical protein